VSEGRSSVGAKKSVIDCTLSDITKDNIRSGTCPVHVDCSNCGRALLVDEPSPEHVRQHVILCGPCKARQCK